MTRRASTAVLLTLVAAGAVTASTAARPAGPTRVSAAIAAKSRVSGIFLASLGGKTLAWQLILHGISGTVSARIEPRRQGPALATLCSPCKLSSRGRTQLGAPGAQAVASGDAYVAVRAGGVPALRVRARIVIGVPSLEIVSPKSGDTIALPAQVTYRVTNFGVGSAPLGHLEVWVAGVPTSVEVALTAASGTATIPDVKSAFLPGHRELNFSLATADRSLVPNAEARVTVSGVTIAGRK